MSSKPLNVDDFMRLNHLHEEAFNKKPSISNNILQLGGGVVTVIATVSFVFGCCFALVPLLMVAAACATIAVVFFAIQIYRGFNDDKENKWSLFHEEKKPWLKQETINLKDHEYEEWKNRFDNYHGQGVPLGNEKLLKWLFYKKKDSGHWEIPKDLFEICNNQPLNIKRAHQSSTPGPSDEKNLTLSYK